MKRIILLFLMLPSLLKALGARDTAKLFEEQTPQGEHHKTKPEERARRTPKPHARGSRDEAVHRFYEGRNLKSFIRQLRIYQNPKATRATKARAAQRLVRLQKMIKNPTFKKYITTQLQRHHISPKTLEKEAKFATNYLEFNHLINRYAKRKKLLKTTKGIGQQRVAKRLTSLYKQLPEAYRKEADTILEMKHISHDELNEATKPREPKSAKTALNKPASYG